MVAGAMVIIRAYREEHNKLRDAAITLDTIARIANRHHHAFESCGDQSCKKCRFLRILKREMDKRGVKFPNWWIKDTIER